MSRAPSFGSWRVLKINNASSSAARIPAIGVHSPMSRSPPGIVEVSASEAKMRVPGAAIAVIPFVRKYPRTRFAARAGLRRATHLERSRTGAARSYPPFALNSTFKLKASKTPKRVWFELPFRAPYRSIIPRLMAMVTACVRSFALNLERMLFT